MRLDLEFGPALDPLSVYGAQPVFLYAAEYDLSQVASNPALAYRYVFTACLSDAQKERLVLREGAAMHWLSRQDLARQLDRVLPLDLPILSHVVHH
ncbi:MAG: hypothetical protein AAF213_05245, partial [Pseudomonadota bacterium]